MENEKLDLQSLAKSEYEVARLRFIDKASRLVGALLLTICLILIAFAVLTFGAAAAIFALAQCIPTWAACLIIGAVYLLLVPVLFACSKVLFFNPIVNKLSGIKTIEELQCETARAEGRAAVQRERVNGQLRLVKTIYRYIRKWLKL
ncbi:MAG: phage holin family protein [Paludibacteraceae bacterium]|nr:phage holin family protein [Paludibacteraceae bacterium]MBR6492346.1 phage holin family protein [Paludibacteraceae bacterium]